MKKHITYIAVAFILVFALFCLCSCDFGSSSDRYSVMNKILRAEHENVKLDVVTEKDGTTLHSAFDVHNSDDVSTVQYSVQQLATFEDNQLPDNYIKTLNGTVELRNGEVVKSDGDEIEVNFEIFSFGYNFKDKFFSDAKYENGAFTAKVTNVNSFVGDSEFDGTNMTVRFNYADIEPQLVVAYTTASGVSVTMTYKF